MNLLAACRKSHSCFSSQHGPCKFGGLSIPLVLNKGDTILFKLDDKDAVPGILEGIDETGIRLIDRIANHVLQLVRERFLGRHDNERRRLVGPFRRGIGIGRVAVPGKHADGRRGIAILLDLERLVSGPSW